MKHFTAATIITLLTISLLVISCSRDQEPTAEKIQEGPTVARPQIPPQRPEPIKDPTQNKVTYSEEQLEKFKEFSTGGTTELNQQQAQQEAKQAAMNDETRARLAKEIEELKDKGVLQK